MTTNWHYALDGHSAGPESQARIEDMIRAGQIHSNSLVWRQGMTDWEPAYEHFPFAPDGTFLIEEPGTTHGPGPARNIFSAFFVCLWKYFSLGSRASRSEFWYFLIVACLFLTALVAVEDKTDVLTRIMVPGGTPPRLLSGAFGLMVFLPFVAVTVRRLHDTGRSGWWLMSGIVGALAVTFGISAAVVVLKLQGVTAAIIVTAIGAVVILWSLAMLVFLCLRGTPGQNRYG